MKTIWTVLISALIAGGLAGGGAFYFVNKKAATDKDALRAQISTLNTKVAESEKFLLDVQAAVPQANTAQSVTNPTADWKTYTLPREKISFKYPSNWTLNDASQTKGVTNCGGQEGCADQNIDFVTLSGPDGFQVGIGNTVETTISNARRQGQGCVASHDTCTNYYFDAAKIAGKDLFLVTTGYLNQNMLSLELGVSQYKDCIQNCRTGIGKAKTLEGNIQVYAQYPGVYKYTPEEFASDQNIVNAKLVFKSIQY